MISWRKYFSIAIMMIVLLFLFQFSLVLKDSQNAYDKNAYATEKQADGQDSWQMQQLDLTTVGDAAGGYAVFVGDAASDMAVSVSRWCTYAKWNMAQIDTLASWPSGLEALPGMVVLESEKYAQGDALQILQQLAGEGVIVVFGCLENPQTIAQDAALQDFIGVREIREENTELTGIKLFRGLLLGGEAVYQEEENADAIKRQDLPLQMPWYILKSGTKTYMVGMKQGTEQQETIKNEELPAILWRNGSGGGSVFAVAGDFMKDSTAIGLLDGMVAEASSYYIYPVVNAQNLSLIDFPMFADENNEEMMQLYSQSATGMARDVIWPSLISIAEKSGFRMTCFLQPQADYQDTAEPDSGDLVFYLRQMKEQNAEAALSLQYREGNLLTDKLEKDGAFYQSTGSAYRYGAAFLDTKDMENVKQQLDTGLLQQVSTVVTDYTEDAPVLSYCTDDVTRQSVVSDGMYYSYSDDLRMRSVQSALGYTNVMLNMQKIFWPAQDTDKWQIMQKQFASNLTTYWKPFRGFASTTISESNSRVRMFLKTDFSQERTGDEIMLHVTETNSWFLLRTHGEEIAGIQGGSYEQLEENVYLIQAQADTVKLQLEPAAF